MIVCEHGVRKHKVDEHKQQRGGKYLRSFSLHAAKLPRIREIRKNAGEWSMIRDKCCVGRWCHDVCVEWLRIGVSMSRALRDFSRW